MEQQQIKAGSTTACEFFLRRHPQVIAKFSGSTQLRVGKTRVTFGALAFALIKIVADRSDQSDRLRWGILGTGNIARQFAAGVAASARGRLAAVASRSAHTARAFARARQVPADFGSYDDLLRDPGVDVVYVSLPNTLHHPWTVLTRGITRMDTNTVRATFPPTSLSTISKSKTTAWRCRSTTN